MVLQHLQLMDFQTMLGEILTLEHYLQPHLLTQTDIAINIMLQGQTTD